MGLRESVLHTRPKTSVAAEAPSSLRLEKMMQAAVGLLVLGQHFTSNSAALLGGSRTTKSWMVNTFAPSMRTAYVISFAEGLFSSITCAGGEQRGR
eukprot:7426893-Pyramimonas_sp.AAC.1